MHFIFNLYKDKNSDNKSEANLCFVFHAAFYSQFDATDHQSGLFRADSQWFPFSNGVVYVSIKISVIRIDWFCLVGGLP